jgi:hypothetical protein
MMWWEKIAVFSEIHKKTLFGQNVDVSNVKIGGR